MKKTVLILSTDATRTGTPILLLNTLKWLNANSELRFVVVLQRGGELLSEYKSLCDVWIWPDTFPVTAKLKSGNLLIRAVKNTLLFLKKLVRIQFIQRLKRRYSIDLIYSNTTRNGEALELFKKIFGSGVILHVHEGGRTMDLFNSQGYVEKSVECSDKIIVVSESVKTTLQEKFNPHQEIVVIPGGIDTGYTYPVDPRILMRAEGITDDKLIILTCGWLDWHKGTDLFIQVARELNLQHENLHFVWLGGKEKDPEYAHMTFDTEKLGLTGQVTIIPSKPNANDYIKCCDIFLMLSREESFSLVTVEAGLAGKPVLCFDKSGGPVEIVSHDSRFIVPYADVPELCRRITELAGDRKMRETMGNDLRNRVIANYSIEKQSSSVLEVIKSELYRGNAPTG